MELGPILGYHAVLFITHTAAYIYDCKYIVTNETDTVFTYRGYGGKFKYLTNWNFCLHLQKMVSKSLVFFLPVYVTQVYGLTWDIFLLPMGWETYGGKFKYLTFINMNDMGFAVNPGTMAVVKLVFHLSVWILLSYSLYINVTEIRAEDAPDVLTSILTIDGFGGKFKYLTFWYFIIQTVYFGLCVANDLCGSNVRPSGKGQRSRLQRWRDNFLATVVFPLGMFVVLTFWGIYAIDRELVYPKALDKVIPSWLNHIMHTTILPFLLIDKFLVYHQYPSRKTGFVTIMSLALLYLTWILWVAYYANIWVYPILKVLQPHHKVVFILAMLVFFIFLYLLGEFINKTIWGKERSHAQKKKNKSS